MKLTIIGASGHGRVVADIAALCGYDEIEFLDDNEELKFCGAHRVVGKTSKATELTNDVFVGIGNAAVRKKFMDSLKEKNLITLVHPNAIVASDVSIGKGSVVMAGAVINSGAVLGDGVIVNTCSSIDHDCKVGNYVHVAVGAHLCGTVAVGENTWIGAGATVSNNVDICSDCMIGAGAVVVKNIEEKGTYMGIPVKIVKTPQKSGGD